MIANKRMCIYPKDIQRITGYSERFGRKLLTRIKKSLNKESHHYISVDEFCAYTGLVKGQVLLYLID
jgi:hypothetical protein